MHPRQIVASLVIGVLVLLLIVRLVQKGRLDIAYCWLWLGIGIGMLAVVAGYGWLTWLSNMIGAVLPTTTLFLFAIIVLFLMCLQFSLVISKHRRQIKALTQQVALLSEAKGDAGAASGAGLVLRSDSSSPCVAGFAEQGAPLRRVAEEPARAAPDAAQSTEGAPACLRRSRGRQADGGSPGAHG